MITRVFEIYLCNDQYALFDGILEKYPKNDDRKFFVKRKDTLLTKIWFFLGIFCEDYSIGFGWIVLLRGSKI